MQAKYVFITSSLQRIAGYDLQLKPYYAEELEP